MTTPAIRNSDGAQDQVDSGLGSFGDIASSDVDRPNLRFATMVLCCCFLIGCSEPAAKRVTVSGTVMIDQEPLTNGMIRFIPEQGRPTSSAILADGSFDMASTPLVESPSQAGVALGKHQIEVSASEIIDEDTIRWHAPKKYASFRTSGLVETIKESTSDLVIELTWDGVEGPITETQEELPVEEDVTSEPEAKLEDNSGAEKSDSNADE